jgi:UDP-2,3-diacylglucosamine pyrophosphatase LpxH
MDAYRRDFIKLSAITAVSLLISGCKEEHVSSDVLNVRLYPDDGITECTATQLVLEFNKVIDPLTFKDIIFLDGQTGLPFPNYTVMYDPDDPLEHRVAISLDDGSHLKESWKYKILITEKVRSLDGATLPNAVSLKVVTGSRSPFETVEEEKLKRSKIVVISDLHMNEQRGYDEGYSLFTENAALLEAFLEQVRSSEQIKELVILGDLMDMWVIPMAYHTFHDEVDDTEAYFRSVAEAEINKGVIAKINQIADEGFIRFSYVPGNHDMLFTEEMFYAIFPNGHWQGGAPGTGSYSPETTVVFEHGHNYDLFNAPDSVTTEGSLLPPGYFITRIYATGNLQSTEKLPINMESTENQSAKLIYTTAWDLAVLAINIPQFDPTKPQIYTHVDGYTKLYSSKGARDIYTQDIGKNWQKRQQINGVAVPNPEVIGILNGSGKFFWFGTLEYSAIAQYFIPLKSNINIVVFGHTHRALLKQDWETLHNIYANSGTWIDKKYLNKNALTATCIVLNSAASSGSDIDNVTFYQAVEESGNVALKKIDEKVLDSSEENAFA